MFGRYPFACRSFDEFVEQMDQGRQRGKIHDHRDVTAYVTFADGEVDEEKQDYITGLRRGARLKKVAAFPRRTSGSDILRLR